MMIGGVLLCPVVFPTVGKHLDPLLHGNRQCGGEGQHVDDDRHIGVEGDGRRTGESPLEPDGIGALLVGGVHAVTLTDAA
ncbi:Uncharacterised protein [Rhodococcus gordoniae]|uniref:Uncharacterized protein n=1 Tax=Rhodococcus gordoniae TaxID=223392 RepID=A0A379PQE9_9NOCA|nr:Uncharacterised protein [Rhodococcus gordoniae]